jgi:hypothetical protein
MEEQHTLITFGITTTWTYKTQGERDFLFLQWGEIESLDNSVRSDPILPSIADKGENGTMVER